MMDFVAAFQHWLTLACFVALAVCLFALAVLCAIPKLTDAIRRFCGMDNFSKVVCGVCIVGAVLYGGSKGVNVRWDDGLRDNGTLITNDTVSVRWTYSGIPSASSVFIDYREAGSTNEWLNLAETLASAQEWTGTLANATNYDYWVYSTYVPPVPVHTNGVWVGQAYETKARVGAKSFLILNGKVQEHGRTIATPAAKRRYEHTYCRAGLLAMWDGIDHGNDPLIWRDLSGNGYDATQRVANAGWSWGNNAYIGTANNGHGFRTPIAIANALREHIDGHTIEIVYLPRNTSRQTIFGQYKVAEHRNGGLNIEYSPHQPGWFRVYYSSSPDFNTPAWKKTQSRLTCAVVCDENDLRLYENGVHTSTAAKPNVDTIGYSKPFIIGGENERTNMSIVGELFCVRVYSRALTEEELKRHVEIDNERFN